MCVHGYVTVCVCKYVHVLCVYMCVDVCVHMYFVCTCVCMCVHVLCVYMCMYVCACTLCVCVYICKVLHSINIRTEKQFQVSLLVYIHCAHKCEYFGVLPLYHIAC